jgi:acyl dehydratase
MIVHINDLASRIGEEIGVSPWLEVTQQRITQFADATGDQQWIHVDPARAAAESPYKTTIAHGFLTLSLVSSLLKSALTVEGLRLSINYGCDRVRFVSPVPSGSRVRGRFALTSVEAKGDGFQVNWGVTVEREGHERPCVVLSWLVRYYPSDG